MASKHRDGQAVPNHSLAFRLKCERELDKLKAHLSYQLKNDMLKLMNDNSCADFKFTVEGQEVFAHSSILKVRVPRFYNYCLATPEVGTAPYSVSLLGLKRDQLHNFFRTVYCNEEVGTEETAVLKILSKSQPLPPTSTMTTAAPPTSNGPRMSEGHSLPISTDTSSPHDDSLEVRRQHHDPTRDQPHPGHDDDDDDVHHHPAGLLLAVTAADEQYSSSECLHHPQHHTGTLADVTDPFSLSTPLDTFNVSTLNLGSDRASVTSIEDDDLNDSDGSSEKVAEFDHFETRAKPSLVTSFLARSKLGAEQDLSVDSVDGTVPCVGADRPRTEVVERPFPIGCDPVAEDAVQEVTTDIKGPDVVMLCSHESKEGDSGICSFNQRISASSRMDHDCYVASPSGSLPKDDSLEFCPDSLASSVNAASAAVMFGLPVASPGETAEEADGTNWLHLEEDEERDERSTTALDRDHQANGTLSRSLGKDRPAWTEYELDRGTDESRRWSLSGACKSLAKPSAIVMPYNVDDDDFVRPNGHEGEGAAASRPDPPPPGEGLRRQSVRLDFVPILKETATPENGHRPQRHHHPRPAANWFPESENYDIFVDNAVHVPPPPDQTAAMESLPIITGYAPLPNGTAAPPAGPADPHPVSEGDRVRPFYSGFVDAASPSAAVDDAATRRQKQEAFFMFIDVGKANGAPAKSMEELGVGEHPVEGAQDRRDPPPSAEIVVGASREVVGTPPPPVYMYIGADAGEPAGHHVRIRAPGPGDKHDAVRRRGRCGGRGRPKSESAATLSPQARAEVDGKADKRMSLGFEDEDDVTYSIDNSLEVDVSRGGRGEERKRNGHRGAVSKLGEQLLRMFLEEVNSDVIVRVGDKDIRAHKSILSSRCAYFAAMLSGGWVESSGNVVKLQGFSYASVHFAVRHIYGGAAAVPDELDLSELASLADMLGLEGLKEVVALALKIKYCHFFHKPCAVCAAGISECLLIAASFGLEDLQEGCLRWITRHQLKIWPTKAFAALPDDILHKCYLSVYAEMTPANVIDTLLNCDKLLATLPHVKWAEPVFALTTRLSEAGAEHLAAHFAQVLRSDTFLGLKAGQSWNIHALEATFLLAVERLPLEVACQAYVHLSATQQPPPPVPLDDDEDGGHEVPPDPEINENFESLVNKIHRQVEHFLIHNANRIVRCNSWSLLSATLQKKIRDAAVIVFEFGKPTAPPPRLSSLNRKFVGARSGHHAPSPSVERAARVAASRVSASKSLTSSVVARKAEVALGHHHHVGDRAKSATLPRAGAAAGRKMEVAGESHQRVSSPMVPAAAPLVAAARGVTKRVVTANIRSSAAVRNEASHKVDAGRDHRKMSQSVPADAVANTCPAKEEEVVVASAQPKLLAAKDKVAAVPVAKQKEKILVKDVSKEVKPVAASNGVPLRSTSRIANGVPKAACSTQRPKSAGFQLSSSRISKQPAPAVTTGTNNLRDSKTGGMRKTISSDLHTKDKEESRIKARPRSDDVSSSSTSKRPTQRLNVARTSRPSTSKV